MIVCGTGVWCSGVCFRVLHGGDSLTPKTFEITQKRFVPREEV
jgi:hypothetical protein